MNKTHLISKKEMMLKMRKTTLEKNDEIQTTHVFWNLSMRLEHHPLHKKSQKSRYNSEDEKL